MLMTVATVFAFVQEDGADKLDVLYGYVSSNQNETTDTLHVEAIPEIVLSYDEVSVGGGVQLSQTGEPVYSGSDVEAQEDTIQIFTTISSFAIPFLVAVTITGLFIFFFFVFNRRKRYDDE